MGVVAVPAGVSRRPAEAVDDEVVSQFHQSDHPFSPLTVVIAAYDEEGSIGSVLARVPDVVCGLPTSVLVVADGCTDDTAGVARSTGAVVCATSANRGQGAALRLGYRLAREGGASIVATLDADGQYDPAELELVVRPIVDGTADFVTGSRRLGDDHGARRLRATGVVLFARVISLLGGQPITDPANGLRAMRAEVTGTVSLRQPQYQAAELILGAALRGYRIGEVPTTMSPRTSGRTKKGPDLLYGIRFARVIITTWLRGG